MRQWLFWVSQTKLSWEIFWRPHRCRFPAVFWVGTEFLWGEGVGEVRRRKGLVGGKTNQERRDNLISFCDPTRLARKGFTPLCWEWVSREWRKPAKETICWTGCTSERKVIKKDGDYSPADFSRLFTFARLRSVWVGWLRTDWDPHVPEYRLQFHKTSKPVQPWNTRRGNRLILVDSPICWTSDNWVCHIFFENARWSQCCNILPSDLLKVVGVMMEEVV